MRNRLRLILEDIDELGSGLACLDERCDEDGQRADTRIVGELLQGIGDIHEAGVREHIAESLSEGSVGVLRDRADGIIEGGACGHGDRHEVEGVRQFTFDIPAPRAALLEKVDLRQDVPDHTAEGGRRHGGKSRQLGADEDADDDSHGDADDLRGPEHERGDLEAGTHEGFALALLLLTGHGTEQGGTLEGLAELEALLHLLAALLEGLLVDVADGDAELLLDCEGGSETRGNRAGSD